MINKIIDLKNIEENLKKSAFQIDDKNLVTPAEVEARQGLQDLLLENLAMTKEIRVMVRHINTYVAWQRIFGWVKLLLLLVPIILGLIYLPPIISGAYNKFLQMIISSINVAGY